MRPRKRPKQQRAEGVGQLSSTDGAEAPPGLICLGVVLGAHGLRGAVRIKSFAMNASDIAAYGPLQSDDGAMRFALTVRGVSRGAVLAELEGINRREAAEALKGTRLYVPREALPTTDENEFYHTDLIGLAAHTADGEVYGVVKSINNHGAGDVIEIERDNTQSKFLPFSRDIVPVINLAEGYLTIDPPIEIDAKRSDEDSGEGLGENVSEDVDEVDSDG